LWELLEIVDIMKKMVFVCACEGYPNIPLLSNYA